MVDLKVCEGWLSVALDYRLYQLERVIYALYCVCVFTHKAADRVVVYYGRRAVRSAHIVKVKSYRK